MTLVEFLRARYNEDERLAAAASPGPWHTDEYGEEVFAADGIMAAEAFALSGNQTRATAAFIANWNPSRVLADIAGKRALLEILIERAADYDNGGPWWPNDALRLLARPFTDHPEYLPEWTEEP